MNLEGKLSSTVAQHFDVQSAGRGFANKINAAD